MKLLLCETQRSFITLNSRFRFSVSKWTKSNLNLIIPTHYQNKKFFENFKILSG